FTYLSSVSYNEDKKLDKDTFVYDIVTKLSKKYSTKPNSHWFESESFKERHLLDGHKHGKKPDFRIFTKIDDTDRELMFGSEIKIFSIDLAFDGLYRFNLLSKLLLPTENANFLNINTVVSTLYSLLERVRFTISTINSSQSSTQSSPRHSYCRNSNSSPKKICVLIVGA
ncbi:10856_t:CDS:2, partial [Funneliformis geosporum]